MTQRLTTTPDPLTERVIQRLMARNNCSRAQAGQIILKYGTKGIIESLRAKNPKVSVDELMAHLVGDEQ